MKISILSILAIFASIFSLNAERKITSKFEQDREAILSMAGKHSVSFNFHEVFRLSKDYKIKDDKYHETADELVVVADDTGKQIILQHILQVNRGKKKVVIKHWSQIWTFEDTEILVYQKNRLWEKKNLSKNSVSGKWTQLVNQTDDSPRYEGIGTWVHTNGISEWVSNETPRPLPRREYSKRDDYDLLMAYNKHIVTPWGWTHEQSNKKLVKRKESIEYLALEYGFNKYSKVSNLNLDAAAREWDETKAYWSIIRQFWNNEIKISDSFSYNNEVEGKSLRKAIRLLIKEAAKKQSLTTEEVNEILSKYLLK